jgi:hypothetical protein
MARLIVRRDLGVRRLALAESRKALPAAIGRRNDTFLPTANGRLGNYLRGESPFGTGARTRVVPNSAREDIARHEFGSGDDPRCMQERQFVLLDAHLAGMKVGLKLNEQQAKIWPAFESAVRGAAKARSDRWTQARMKWAQWPLFQQNFLPATSPAVTGRPSSSNGLMLVRLRWLAKAAFPMKAIANTAAKPTIARLAVHAPKLR